MSAKTKTAKTLYTYKNLKDFILDNPNLQRNDEFYLDGTGIMSGLSNPIYFRGYHDEASPHYEMYSFDSVKYVYSKREKISRIAYPKQTVQILK